jgi:hypothetical protein
MDNAPPPIKVWYAVAGAHLSTLLAGTNLYSMGAGGFSQVPAFPTMLRIKQPANPNSRNYIRDTQLYVTDDLPTKQAIRRQFGVI